MLISFLVIIHPVANQTRDFFFLQYLSFLCNHSLKIPSQSIWSILGLILSRKATFKDYFYHPFTIKSVRRRNISLFVTLFFLIFLSWKSIILSSDLKISSFIEISDWADSILGQHLSLGGKFSSFIHSTISSPSKKRVLNRFHLLHFPLDESFARVFFHKYMNQA